jgi:hypothetical protein
MKLNEGQFAMLGSLVVEVNERDQLGCDGCSELIAQFADTMIAGDEIDPMLEAVREHLLQCRCCRYEYEALLVALREIAAVS